MENRGEKTLGGKHNHGGVSDFVAAPPCSVFSPKKPPLLGRAGIVGTSKNGSACANIDAAFAIFLLRSPAPNTTVFGAGGCMSAYGAIFYLQ